MSKVCTIALILALSAVSIAQKPVAELPRVRINSTYALPTGGTTWAAHTSAQLSSAITYSAPGDVIVLDAGTTYSGNFQLPAKTNPNNKWIYVQTSAYSSLPSPGTRVAPANSPQMPKIVTPGATGALAFRDGANHWRFVGIEVLSASSYHPTNYTPGVNFGYALIGDFSMVPVNLPDSDNLRPLLHPRRRQARPAGRDAGQLQQRGRGGLLHLRHPRERHGHASVPCLLHARADQADEQLSRSAPARM